MQKPLEAGRQEATALQEGSLISAVTGSADRVVRRGIREMHNQGVGKEVLGLLLGHYAQNLDTILGKERK